MDRSGEEREGKREGKTDSRTTQGKLYSHLGLNDVCL
jgi:hypothetical protein